MEEQKVRRPLDTVLTVLECAFLSALVAGGVLAALSVPIGYLAMSLPGVTDPLQAIWVLTLAPFAAGGGALFGALIAAFRLKRLSPLPWLWAGGGATTIVFLITLISVWLQLDILASFSVLLFMVIAALVIPAASATGIYALLARRTRRQAMIGRLVLVAAVAIGLIAAGVYARRSHKAGFGQVSDAAINASGRLFVATESGILQGEPPAYQWQIGRAHV